MSAKTLYMRIFFVVVILLALAIAGLVLTVRHVSAPLCARCNVIVIAIDTLGAKHTSVYTPSLDTTPFLRELADTRAIVFEHAYAQSSWTLPSQTALLTGAYPWDVQVWDVMDPIPQRTETLAETLQKQGYRTAAFSVGSFVQPERNFDQGFDAFYGTSTRALWNDLPEMFEEGAAWIETNKDDEPFFLFLRPFHVHDPYGVPGEGGIDIKDISVENLRADGPREESVTHFKAAYHEEVRQADDALRSFFGDLETAGMLSDTIIILVSDHGEEFGEHGTAGFHAVTLYAEAIHVPLIMYIPGQEPQRLSPSVELRSLPHTILELVGIPSFSITSGASLVPIIQGTNVADRVVISKTVHERNQLLEVIPSAYDTLTAGGSYVPPERTTAYDKPHTTSVLKGTWHIIQNPDTSLELYDVYADPEEAKNLIDLMGTLPVTAQQDIQSLMGTLYLGR